MKKHKQQFRPLVLYLLTIFFATIFYLQMKDAVYYALEDIYPPLLHPVFVIASIAVMYISTIILHETGHLIFGLLTGYRFVSFRIFSLILARQEHGFKVRRSKIPGIGGQCLMQPPPMDHGRYPVKLYLWGGLLFNIAQVIVLVILLLTTQWFTIAHEFSIPFITFVCYIFLINAVPCLGPMRNDGANIRSLRKDSGASEALWYSLEINRLQQEGVRHREMPEDWFRSLEDCDLSLYSGQFMAVLMLDLHLDTLDFEGVLDLGFQVLQGETGMQESQANAIYAEMLFCAILTQKDPHTMLLLRRGISDAFRKSVSAFPSIWRLQYAESMLLDHDPNAAETAKKMFERTLKSSTSKAVILQERELMTCLEQMIANT